MIVFIYSWTYPVSPKARDGLDFTRLPRLHFVAIPRTYHLLCERQDRYLHDFTRVTGRRPAG